jgi:general stress protein YciG
VRFAGAEQPELHTHPRRTRPTDDSWNEERVLEPRDVKAHEYMRPKRRGLHRLDEHSADGDVLADTGSSHEAVVPRRELHGQLDGYSLESTLLGRGLHPDHPFQDSTTHRRSVNALVDRGDMNDTRPHIESAPHRAALCKRPMAKSRGFGSMSTEQQRAIASKGGKAAHEQGAAHEFTPEEARAAGTKGGVAVSRDRAHMAEIGRRGGEARRRTRSTKADG